MSTTFRLVGNSATRASGGHDLFGYACDRARATGRALVIYSGAPWGIGGGAQPPQAYADCLADQAAVVHIAHGNQALEEPVASGAIVRPASELEQWLCLPAHQKVFYTSFPDEATVNALEGPARGWDRVYHCLDDWQHFDWAAKSWWQEEREKKVVQSCDLLLCTAERLRERMARHKPYSTPQLLRNCTRIAGKPWAEKRDVDFVCVGWLADTWPDWELFRALCELGSVRIVGKLPGARPFEHPNAIWHGEVAYHQLMPLLSSARVGVIPFRDIPLVWAVDPIKYYDYLAAGLPTVASYMPELQGRLGADAVTSLGEFVGTCAGLLEAGIDETEREALRSEALLNTDVVRSEQLATMLQEAGAW